MYDYGTWKPILKKSLGPLNAINERMYWLSSMKPDDLPNLRTSQTLFIASDYSGEHASADYQIISLVITDADALYDWKENYRQITN